MFPFTKLANLLEMFDWYQHFWMRLSQNLLILQMKWSLTLTVWFFLLKPVFNTFQQRWKVFMHSDCLSVCFSVRTLSYSSNILKFTCAIHIWYSMERIKNSIHTTNGSSTETHKNFSMHYDVKEENILTYLYWIKCSEINIYHSVIQTHVSNKKRV